MDDEGSSGGWRINRTPERLRLERTARSQVLRVDENFTVERTPECGVLSDRDNLEPFLRGRSSKSGRARRPTDSPVGVVSSKAARRSTRQLFAFAPQSTPVPTVRQLGCDDKVIDYSSSETELSPISTGSSASFLVPRQSHLVLTDSHEELSFSVAESNSVRANIWKGSGTSFMTVEEEELIGDCEPIPAEAEGRPPRSVKQSAKIGGKEKGHRKKKKGSTVKRLAGGIASPFVELPMVEQQREQRQLERQKRFLSELAERSEGSSRSFLHNKENSPSVSQRQPSKETTRREAREGSSHELAYEVRSSVPSVHFSPLSESNRSPSPLVRTETNYSVPVSVPSVEPRESSGDRGFVPSVAASSDSSDWSPPRGLTFRELKELMKKRAEDRRLKSRGCGSKPGKLLKKGSRNLPRSDGMDIPQPPYCFDGVQRRLKNKFSYSPVYTVSGSTPPGYSTPTGGETDPDMDFLGD